MSVDRNKDGSVTIRDNTSVTIISSIIAEASDDKREDKYQQWIEDSAKLVTACPRTIKETVQYFLEQCDAEPIAINDKRMKNFQFNVIMNYHKDKLKHRASKFSFDMTDEEMQKWHKEKEAMRQEVMSSSPEQFGLIMHGYYLPQTERNKIFYEQAYQESQEFMNDINQSPNELEKEDISLLFEETTGHYECSGGRSLMNHLIAFRGVSQDDIEKRNIRFLGYISALREMGNLPDFMS